MDDNKRYDDDQSVTSAREQPSSLSAAQPQQPPSSLPKYGVISSLNDALAAIRANLGTYAVTVVIGVVLSAVMTYVYNFAVIAVIGGVGLFFVFSAGSTPSILPILILFFGAVTIISILFSAWLFTLNATAVADGANGMKRSAGSTLSVATRAFVRVALAEALFFLVLTAPLLALVTLSFVLALVFGAESLSAMSILYFIGGIAGSVWILVAFLRYLLVPYVALFEPEVPLRQTLGRSKHLMMKGGQWYVVKLILLCIVAAIALSPFAGEPSYSAQAAEPNIFISLAVTALSLLVGAMVVMLYRNRRQVT